MGQAKNRGSRDDRVAHAQGLVQRSLDEIRQELGLPPGAQFLGYGIHVKDRDEFLAFIKDSPSATQKAWTKDPVNAMTYGNIEDAFADSKKCAGSIIVGMFDLGDRIHITQIGSDSDHTMR